MDSPTTRPWLLQIEASLRPFQQISGASGLGSLGVPWSWQVVAVGAEEMRVMRVQGLSFQLKSLFGVRG